MKKNKLDIQPLLHSGLGRFYLAALLATLYGFDLEAQNLSEAPRLVVNITIDQLRSDYLEQFSKLYSQEGFRRLLNEGRVYENVEYPFSPIDRASAIACVATGATPQYSKIIAEQWLNRKTLRPEYCVNDQKYVASPEHLATSTISDELKVATKGKAQVYGIAKDQDAAILSAGHAADGAYWIDAEKGKWTTSSYYPQTAISWIKTFRTSFSEKKGPLANDLVSDMALSCVSDNALGKDDDTDYLAVTLSARQFKIKGKLQEMNVVYSSLDTTLGNLINGIEQKVGKDNVLFVLTATGDTEEQTEDYKKYRIPTGTFYINRSAQLLNMFLTATYGSGQWVEGYFKNQIYLNHKLIEDRKISYTDIIQRSKDLLKMSAGVVTVSESPLDTEITGDLWVEVSPGWTILNEDTNTSYQTSTALVPFPVIFLGAGFKAEHVDTPISTVRIAPTIAKTIHIRAPNGCSAKPLF